MTQKNAWFRLSSALFFSFLFLVFSSQKSSANVAQRSPARTLIQKYSEGGLWTVHLVEVDSDGWPETLERSSFSSENRAARRMTELKKLYGAKEEDRGSSSSDEVTTELKKPLAGEIWTAKNEWDLEWEKKFTNWTRQNFDKKFFKRYKISTDCADAAIGMRWIFSRMNSLPAGNRLIGSTALLTNRSMKAAWKDLPTSENWYEDERFRAALNYLMVNSYTHTLVGDGYPIEINPTYLTEGAFHLEMRKNDGHARVVTEVNRDSSKYPITDMYSNVPREVRTLWTESFTLYDQPEMKFGGFMRHRWVKLTSTGATLVPGESMPGYSLEQYQPDFFKHGIPDFSAEVAARFQEAFDPVVAAKAIYSNLKGAIKDRVKLVEDGYAVCSKESCDPGTDHYENWGTPSRDARIGNYFEQIQTYLRTLSGGDLERFRERYESERGKKYLKFNGERIEYADLETIWGAKRYSSDPKQPPAVRWGL